MNKFLGKVAVVTAVAVAVLSTTACERKQKFIIPADGQAASSGAITENSTFEDKAAYAIGASLGEYVAQVKASQEPLIGPIDVEMVINGFKDGSRNASMLTRQETETVLKELDKKLQEQAEIQTKKLAEENKKAGEDFLAQNKTKEGVVTTESGLQYKIISEGNGPKPVEGDTISVTYRGTSIDGTVFDEQKKPVQFPLDNMIPGWIEGMKLMNAGSEFELYIPANLAYGENAVGNTIRPNSVLVFEVKLIEVVKKADSKK
ncbi:MAG: FKBP-type peptidyl-prolyl cis-trans isomerase N-terminal domain-containing protein [Succinivibrio sp.]